MSGVDTCMERESVWDVEELEKFLESYGGEGVQRSPSSVERSARDSRMSTQVFHEFAVPTLHNNDLRLECEMCIR